MKRIVIIHSGAIGDLVQTLPLLATVRARWPQATVTLVGRPQRAALAVLAGVADEVVDTETCGLWRVTGEAACEAPAPPVLDGADLVIDLLTKGALATGLRKSTAGQDRPWHTGLRIVSVDPLPPEGWDRSAAVWIGGEVAAHLPLGPLLEAPEIPLTPAAEVASRALLTSRGVGERFFAIHPGSGSTTKNWPPDRFEAIAGRVRDETQREVVWLAGPAERERGTVPVEAAGETVLSDLSLVEVAGVLALADGYVGNDSGITQMAAAVRRPDGEATPTVALFGPTEPRVWAPRGEHVRVVAAPDREMESIGIEAVWGAVSAALIR